MNLYAKKDRESKNPVENADNIPQNKKLEDNKSSLLFLLDIKTTEGGVAKIHHFKEVGNTAPSLPYKGWD